MQRPAVVLALIPLIATWSLGAQERVCHEVRIPSGLSASALLDSALARQFVAAFELPPEGVLFSLIYDEADSLPRVYALNVLSQKTAIALGTVLTPQKPAGQWAVRLRVRNGESAVTLERSQYCPSVLARLEGSTARIPITVRPGDRLPTTGSVSGPYLVAEVLVSETGTVTDVTLLQSSGISDIDAELLRAMRSQHFVPALIDSIPVQTRYRTDGKSPRL